MSQAVGRHRQVEAVGKAETQHDGDTNGDNGNAGGNHAGSYTFNNNGGRTGETSLGNLLGGLVAMRSVIFGSLTDDDTGGKTRNDGEGETQPVFDTQQVEDGEGGNGDEDGTDVGTQRQRLQQVALGSALLGTNEEDAEERQEYTHSGNQHGGDDGLQLDLQTGYAKGGSTQGSGTEYRTAIALVQIGTHTGHVAYIIAYIVGNGSGIARIVLGNVGLDLTHDVGTHVGSLGVDTATHTGKQRLRRSTHTEG